MAQLENKFIVRLIDPDNTPKMFRQYDLETMETHQNAIEDFLRVIGYCGAKFGKGYKIQITQGIEKEVADESNSRRT